ncbi:MAG: hypothetical protein HQL96_05690 [Magnetococcales bacterium]|nr:hypothetical protein [Magnetococcales bacterium]
MNESHDAAQAELDELLEEEPTLLERIAILESDVKLLKSIVNAMPTLLEKDKQDARKSMEEVKVLQNRMTEIASTTVQSNQKMEHLGKVVEVVKKETNSWMVVIIICFSIFFIVSLFIRAG